MQKKLLKKEETDTTETKQEILFVILLHFVQAGNHIVWKFSKSFTITPLRNKQLKSIMAGPHLDQTWDGLFYFHGKTYSYWLLLRSRSVFRIHRTLALLTAGGR